MSGFLFDIPLVIIGFVIVGLLCLFAVVGLRIARRHVLPRLNIESEDGHFIATIVHSVMIFYGLALALILVNVSETYTDTQKIVSAEATASAMLYQDISCYPEPTRTLMQNELRAYMQYVIHAAWPLQQHGQMPGGGAAFMNHFQQILVTYEPVSESQKLFHAEALDSYNEIIYARRMRLDAVKTALPTLMWMVIILGAFIGLVSSFFFKVRDGRLHAILVVLLAIFIGLIIFMILAFDRPFHGDLGISADPYQLIYDQLMKK